MLSQGQCPDKNDTSTLNKIPFLCMTTVYMSKVLAVVKLFIAFL